CDDISLAKEVVPSLTTFKWDIERIIKEILELMNDILYGKKIYNKRVLIPAKFILRETLY
ncbi:MAG: substrate-binding domain-containing protein, partial [Dictyoglomus sp.]